MPAVRADEGLAAPPLRVRLLGGFQVRRGEEPIPEQAWARRKARTLFTLLALSRDRRCHKERLLELLWPDLDVAAATNNLHKTLYFLRRILSPAADAQRCPYVRFDGEAVSLPAAYVGRSDVEEFERAAAEALAFDEPARYASALDLYAGDLLPNDLYEDWAIPRREALRQTYLALLSRLGELQVARREHGAAIGTWQRLLAAESTDESAHAALMRAFALSGQRHQALRQYHLCRQTLARELDAEPLPETTALYQAVLAGKYDPAQAPAPTVSLPPAPYPLVGRQPELAMLLDLLERTAQGGPWLAVIAGAAGVGKTRLAQELAHLAARRGLPVLAGAAYEPVGEARESPTPYGSLVDAIRRFLAGQPDSVRRRLVGPWGTDLARLLPELAYEGTEGAEGTKGTKGTTGDEAARLPLPVGEGGGEGSDTRPSPPSVPSASSAPPATPRRLFEAVAHLLGAAAAARPVCLLLDDLHAADQATLELLGYLLHQPSPFRVLILIAVREEALGMGLGAGSTRLAGLLTRANRRGLLTRVGLAGLSRGETATLVRDRLPGTVSEAVVAAIHETSEGNPLFAEELLRAWQEEGVVVAEDGRWLLRPAEDALPLPTSLRATIGVRLGRLPPEVQELLALAAVAGREFPYHWLEAAGSWGEPALLDLLDGAMQAGVLEEVVRASGPLLYRFHHGLIRQALYESLTAARRRYLHARLADVLEQLEDVSEGTRANHWFAAGRWPWAFCYALTAGDQTLHAFAHAEAVTLYDRALAAARGGWAPSEDLLSRVHAGRARALMGLNRFADAATDLAWLAERARAAGDRAAEGQALSRLATASFWGHDLESAGRHAQEALAIARETGDTLAATMCTSNLGCVALCTGRLAQGVQHLEEVLRRSQELGQPELTVEALACLPGAYHWQGDSARALPLLEEGIALAQREGLGLWLGNLLFFAGLAHGALGQYEQALDSFRRGQRHSQDAGDMFTAVRVVNSLGWIHHELYDVAGAIGYDRQGADMARGFPWPEPLANALVNLGGDELLAGELAQAEHCFAEATGLLERDEWMRWRWETRLLLGQGELALARRRLDRAADYARQALALAEQTGARKNLARGHLLLGEVALAAAEPAKAAAALHQAVALAREVDNPRLLWQSLAALGTAARRQGDGPTAAASLAEATRVVHAIAGGLRDESLRRAFLGAPPVQRVLRAAQ